jgi:Ca2+-binding RTX toxin-like protein
MRAVIGGDAESPLEIPTRADRLAAHYDLTISHPPVEMVQYSVFERWLAEAASTSGLSCALIHEGIVGEALRRQANVTGSVGNDILVGDGSANVLRGGTGRNLLIGGAGADQLIGGGGDNIQIGGSTAYDGNLAALLAIMAEFERTDLNFHQRVHDIMNGGGRNGSYVLNTDPTLGPVSVFDDGAVGILNGGGALDWFFAHKKHDVINNSKPGDKTTLV